MPGRFPTSVPVDGNTRIDFVPAIANTQSPAMTELNAVAAKNLSKYFTADGWAPSGEQATIADDRLSEPQTFSQPGRETNGLTVRYVFNTAVPADDEARIAFVENAVGFLVKRGQKDRDDAYAVGQFVEVWPVKCGTRRILAPEANAVDRIEQVMFITGPVKRFAVIVA